MTSIHLREGGCQCGKIRYRIVGEAHMLYACHCTDCQKQSTSAFGMSLIVDVDQVEIFQGEDSLRHWETRGDDGGLKRCAFCPDCGSRLFHGGGDRLSVKAGSLDQTDDLEPIAHIWLRSAQPWLRPDADKILCFDRGPEDGAELERIWREKLD